MYSVRVTDVKVRLECAFPDGALDYVCAECNAHCCRAEGFGGSLRREMGQLLRLYPALDVQVEQRHGDCLSFRTSREGCGFLRPDFRCDVEVEHGKALKPGACVLFPFNHFRWLGDVLFVVPTFVCPLRLVVPPRPGAVQGTHRAILETVHETRLLDPGFLETLTRIPLCPGTTPGATVERELRFRDASTAALGRGRFADLVLAESADRAALAQRVTAALAVLGWADPRPTERDRFDDLMLVLAGPRRVEMGYLPTEALLATLLLAEIALRRSWTYTDRTPTLRDADSLLDTSWPALQLLGLGEEPVELTGRKAPKAPPYSQPDMVLAAYVALRQMKSGVLAAVAQAMTPALSPADRVALCGDLGRLVIPHLVNAAVRPRRAMRAGR